MSTEQPPGLKPGDVRRFDYPKAFTTLPEYTARRGALVTLVRPLDPEKEYDLDPESPDPMWRVQTPDGWTGDAWESELADPGDQP